MKIIRFLKSTPTQEQINKFGIGITNKSYDQYSEVQTQGVKVPGLPVYIAGNEKELEYILTTPTYYRKPGSFVLIADFPDSLFENKDAILGRNLAFKSGMKLPYVNMFFHNGSFYLSIVDKDKIDPSLRDCFNQDNKLKKNDGEYYLNKVPQVGSYGMQIFRFDENMEIQEFKIGDLPQENQEIKIN